MRLRRLELIFITVTLAFAVFMGGFFTGRSWSSVNIMPTATADMQSQNYGGVLIQTQGVPKENPDGARVPASQTNDKNTQDSTTQQVNTIQEPQINPETGTQSEGGAPRGGDGRININLATQSELTDLPGIGSVLASRIIDYRRQFGDFSRVEDIRNVSGIGEKRYEAIQEKITVG